MISTSTPFSVVLLLQLFFPLFSSATRYYVSSSVALSPDNDGLSWDTAYPNPEIALNEMSDNDELWIKEGHYFPNLTHSSRDQCFTLTKSISIYGGFDGTELLLSDRPIPLLNTIFDGDIGQRNNNSDNCYHIIELTPGVNCILNGIIFQNGNANSLGDGTDENQFGGAIHSYETKSMKLTIENCTFKNNSAREGGALWFSDTINITINNCNFEHNKALKGNYLGGYGGAVFCEEYCRMWINNCNFTSNTADHRGGAIYSDYGTHVTIENSRFDGNKITYGGHGGAIFMEDRNSQSDGTFVTIDKCQFTNNGATRYGGAIIWFNGITASITDSIFDSNVAALGGAISNFDSIVYTAYSNNIFTNNIATLNSSHNDIFNDSLPSDTGLTDIVDEINNVNTTQYLEELWETRSYTLEFNYYIEQSQYICYVDAENLCDGNNCGEFDGKSWVTAFGTLQECLDDINDNMPSSVSQGEVWVKTGIYYPTIEPWFAQGSGPAYYSFVMYENISLYGGFIGTETNRNDRNWKNNPTILSCDVSGGIADVCSMILISEMNNIIDGFIFKDSRYYLGEGTRRRRRRLNEYSYDGIGGILTDFSSGLGGGIKSNGTNVKVANCIFTNIVATKGGGIYCMGNPSHQNEDLYSPTIVNAIFVGNAAARAAAIGGDAYCHFTCNYCKFINNHASEKGGAIYLDWECEPSLNTSIFESNFAYESGGCIGVDGSSILTMHNADMLLNGAQFEGGCLYSGSHVGGPNEIYLYNGKFNQNYVNWNGGNDDIWLWQDNTLTISSYNFSYSNQPSNPPNGGDSGNTGDSGDSGDNNDDSDSDGDNDDGSNGKKSNSSIFNELNELEWIIIGASIAFVICVITIICLIRCRVNKRRNNNNMNDGEFRLLDDDGNTVGMDVM